MKIILTGRIPKKVLSEDGGQALITELIVQKSNGSDGSFFVRLQSWNKNCVHETMEFLRGKPVKVTIETTELKTKVKKLRKKLSNEFCSKCKGHRCHTCKRYIDEHQPGSTYFNRNRLHWICSNCSE